MHVYNWFRLLNMITWNISMLKIQDVFEIKKCLCVPKTQITFICSCVNRYNWRNESCDSRFTQLLSEASPIANDWAQHFFNWNERFICINDWYLFVFIHEKYLLSISSVLFIVHLRVINTLKCHAGIKQKYGVTSCRVFFTITCWIRFCYE